MPTNRRITATQSSLPERQSRVKTALKPKNTTIPRKKIATTAQARKDARPKLSSPKYRNQKPNTNQKRKRMVYRRTMILRPWVFPTLFLVPLAIIALEYLVGKIISLDDVKDVYYQQLGIDQWDVHPPMKSAVSPPSILNITHSSRLECPSGLRPMLNVHQPNSHSVESRHIPMIVHQHAESRCLTRNFHRATVQWAFRKWSYYFHDDTAVDRLFAVDYPEFPLLKSVSAKCIRRHQTRVELWSLLNLWVYGGLYVNLNLYPSKFNSTSVLPSDDGFFLSDPNTGMLSTKLMAVSPGHPVMFLAIQRMLEYIVDFDPNGSNNGSNMTGVFALDQALHDLQRSSQTRQVGVDSDHRGVLHCGFGRSIRIAGSLNETDEFVSYVFVSRLGKEREYQKMGMNITDEHETGSSKCFYKLLYRS
jgi:hypothetical protein